MFLSTHQVFNTGEIAPFSINLEKIHCFKPYNPPNSHDKKAGIAKTVLYRGSISYEVTADYQELINRLSGKQLTISLG